MELTTIDDTKENPSTIIVHQCEKVIFSNHYLLGNPRLSIGKDQLSFLTHSSQVVILMYFEFVSITINLHDHLQS